VDDDLGRRLLDLLGEPACRELLAVLELPEPERAALIGQLYASARGQVLAEVLAEVESDPDDLVRPAADRSAPRGARARL